MSQLHSGSLQGMLFSTPFLFNICSKLLHLESISRAWVSKAYSKPQTRLARRKSLCPPPFLPHREQPLWKPHFRGSRREGRLWAKRTALCFSEGSPLQAAVSQINSSVCKSEKKKKNHEFLSVPARWGLCRRLFRDSLFISFHWLPVRCHTGRWWPVIMCH